MGSEFDTLFAGVARPALLGAFGGAVIYYATPGAASGVSLAKASVSAEFSDRDAESEGAGEFAYRRRAVTICTDPSAPEGGVAAPAARAEVEIAGQRWEVESVESFSGSMARLRVFRREAVARTEPGARFKKG